MTFVYHWNYQKQEQSSGINGIEYHKHNLTNLQPSIALADFIRDMKVSTSIWMKNCGYFPDFEGWSDKYGGFSCSYADAGNIAE